MAGLFGFGANPTVEIAFADARTRKKVNGTCNGKTRQLILFESKDDIKGTVTVEPPRGKARIEHTGIKIEFIGRIELMQDRSARTEFTSVLRELEPAGELVGSRQYSFEFCNVDMPYESYDGINVHLRYLVRVTIARQYNTNVVHEQELRVNVIQYEPEINTSIKMEVGIEDCLHIEFEYNRGKYHLRDVILGKIYFLLVRIKIKHMELAVVKRESSGTGPNTFNESETMTKFEIMDGAPVRNESIPIRLFLSGFDQLTPTMRSVNNKFSVKYYLNLVLIDEEDRRYFKQQEITLWRKA